MNEYLDYDYAESVNFQEEHVFHALEEFNPTHSNNKRKSRDLLEKYFEDKKLNALIGDVFEDLMQTDNKWA